jgi:hypothetical protein
MQAQSFLFKYTYFERYKKTSAVVIVSVRQQHTVNVAATTTTTTTATTITTNTTTIIKFIIDKNQFAWLEYKLRESFTVRIETVRVMAVIIDSKLYFHRHVDHVFSQAVRLLGLIRTVFFPPFSSLESSVMLYFTSVIPMSAYLTVAWNDIPSTDASKLQRIQRNFPSLCLCRFPISLQYKYVKVLNYLKFHTLML